MHSLSASILAAVMILCGKGNGKGREGKREGGCTLLLLLLLLNILYFLETGTLTLSQYILLDPPLMFFVMASTYCAVKFQSYKEE